MKIGGLIFGSGFPGNDGNMKIPQGDFGQQKRFALEHIKDKLWYSGSSVDKIGKVNKYVDHLPEFDEVNEICREFFGPEYTT